MTKDRSHQFVYSLLLVIIALFPRELRINLSASYFITFCLSKPRTNFAPVFDQKHQRCCVKLVRGKAQFVQE